MSGPGRAGPLHEPHRGGRRTLRETRRPRHRVRSEILECGARPRSATAMLRFALRGARAGLRACVVTIDPARRLADALGIGEVGNEPHRVGEEDSREARCPVSCGP